MTKGVCATIGSVVPTLIIQEGKKMRVEATPIDKPVDICGASDSFAAGAAPAVAATGDAVAATRLVHLVALINITKKSTGTASPKEVM